MRGTGPSTRRKGIFLALQELNAKPLLRADLRRVMQEQQPGLVVLMTDCCSSRFKLPGKSRRVYEDVGTASAIQPVLRCLLYQSTGIVDITAATGNAAFGDDHDGGIFTRAFDKLVRSGIQPSDADSDGFVTWPEFFSRLQKETEGTFVSWAALHRRAVGEQVEQTSQKPHAFDLAGRPDAVSLRNETAGPLNYQYRWAGQTSWEIARVEPNGVGQHVPPAHRGGASPMLEVRFEGGKTAELHVGKTYRFHGSK